VVLLVAELMGKFAILRGIWVDYSHNENFQSLGGFAKSKGFMGVRILFLFFVRLLDQQLE